MIQVSIKLLLLIKELKKEAERFNCFFISIIVSAINGFYNLT